VERYSGFGVGGGEKVKKAPGKALRIFAKNKLKKREIISGG